MNCFNQSRFDSESVSIKVRCRFTRTPSNTLVDFQDESPDFERYSKSIKSSVPCKII